MSKINRLESKLLLFLVAAIGVLCAGFMIIGCGSGSSLKVADPNAGACALDFTSQAGSLVAFSSSGFANERNIQGKDLTLEAWVKPKGTSTANIFSRITNARGVALGITTSTATPETAVAPQFKIRRVIESGTGPGGTSTVEYLLTGTTDIPINEWSHVAGILVNADHSAVPNDGCTDQHIDIYVDGAVTDCLSTLGGTSAHLDTDNELSNDDVLGADLSGILGYAHNPMDDGYSVAFNGVVDEARLWIADRTGKIETCKDVELASGSGVCGREGADKLAAYQRFNECEGYTVQDFAGIGSGTKEYPDGSGEFPHWETGWVAGAPITPAD